ncbi:ribonuclease Z [Myceligenerans pegani]|uniref:Ribonuclease Z n=1 Tax=Myceligenerans pegani TaxID=2776917 RepID=A0ABR9MV65_9MICO|nr:ribonuclease Z [Myceligenerans sp. TRM 65318]MBE1874931.1 ribonuclease Z [Myceligenerans sp. TRM 65318]MBE3017202.1 ribonuclease Z [Myceligenerans sp. TRM 65318]
MTRTAARELVVLGTSSQVPTRTRNHNGYVLYWDDQAVLFDPGDGTQRQMIRAGVPASDLTRIALTHLHGDHSLGLAGVVQRISLDGVAHTVPVSFPASGEPWVRNLCDATVFHHRERLVLQPLTGAVVVPRVPGERPSRATVTLTARRLDHGIEAFGYRLREADSTSFDPGLLAARGISGPDVGRLQRDGSLTLPDGVVVRREEVSVPRPGQSFAFVMDTRLCDAVGELADGVDLLVIESTYLERDAALASEYGHLTARQAARAAAEAGVRHLVLTHFSQRYESADGSGPLAFEREARTVFDGDLTVANDLDRVPVPRRR